MHTPPYNEQGSTVFNARTSHTTSQGRHDEGSTEYTNHASRHEHMLSHGKRHGHPKTKKVKSRLTIL